MRPSFRDKYELRWQRPKRQPLLNLPSGVALLVYFSLAVHVFRMFLPQSLDNWVLFLGGFIPARFLSLFQGGEHSVSSVLLNILPLFSYNFLHADWMHLIFNLLWLMVFGSMVGRRLNEDREGTLRLLELFFVTGLSGALLHFAFYPGAAVPLIGGSAGVAGLMGAAARILFASYDFSRARRPYIASLTERRVLAFSAIFVGVNVMIGVMGGDLFGVEGGSIAWQAHIAGYFAGLLLYPVFDRMPRR